MSEKSRPILDVDRNTLNAGDSVALLDEPVELLTGLPASDQSAIRRSVNKVMKIQRVNARGYVELEFTDSNGDMHFIWVEPKYLKKEP